MTFAHKAWGEALILIRGAGEMASGVAHRLHRAGFERILMTETPQPLAIRRGVAFAEAVFEGEKEIEGVVAKRIFNLAEAESLFVRNQIGLLVDPNLNIFCETCAEVVVDARMLKKRTMDRYDERTCVISLGPGARAPEDCHYVIETNRGHHLGRVIESGSAEADTNEPAEVMGITMNRVLYSTIAGKFSPEVEIGERVREGQILGYVDHEAVVAKIVGCVRGLLHEGIQIPRAVKIADIDPRGRREYCFTISDKAHAVAGGVLEAVMNWFSTHHRKSLPGV